MSDMDGDGVCDDADACIGVVDACAFVMAPARFTLADASCHPQAIATVMAISSMPLGCVVEIVTDVDADGICDDEDECVGTVDVCGVCNGLETCSTAAAT